MLSDYDALLLILVLGCWHFWLYTLNDCCYTLTETKLEKWYKHLECRFINYMYIWSKQYNYNYFLFGLTLILGFLIIQIYYLFYDLYDEWGYLFNSELWELFLYADPLKATFVSCLILILLLFIIIFVIFLVRLLFIIYLPEYFKK